MRRTCNLIPYQHGFVHGKSCLSNLLEAVREMTTILENEDEVALVYLDFQKAFIKSVPHERLLLKFTAAYGITGQQHDSEFYYWQNNGCLSR